MSAQHHELTKWESLALLQEATIGRLCIVDQGYPIAIPISYTLDGTQARVVVRTAPNTMLGRYEGPGSLEVDSIDLDIGTAWSVIVRGAIRRAIGSYELPDPMPLLTDDRSQWMTLEIVAISGRRFAVHAADDSFAVDWQLASE